MPEENIIKYENLNDRIYVSRISYPAKLTINIKGLTQTTLNIGASGNALMNPP